MLCAVSFAAVRSGRAEADWIGASETYEAEKPVQTALRLVVDAGWHTYWLNPGEGGLPISVAWDLPAGWTAEALEHPVPKRFMTGGLTGFGYGGTVVFPVKFTPPAGFTGEAKLKGKISWLTCNDDSCIPGNAELQLALNPGSPVATAEAKWIDDALLKIPRPNPEIKLAVTESSKKLVLTLSNATTKPFDPAEYEIFPATLQAVDPAAKFQFANDSNRWTAEVPKSEYAASPLKELTLVLAGTTGQAPMALTWKSE